MDLTIRTARPSELDAAGELTARAYLHDGLLASGQEDPYLSELRDARRRARHAEVLVAVDTSPAPGGSGELLGTVTYVADGGEFAELSGSAEAEFRMLAVADEARGRGVGEALARACVDRARRQGKKRVVLSSKTNMRTAHRLYERLGFVRAPQLDWEPIPGLTLLVFVLDIHDTAGAHSPLGTTYGGVRFSQH